MEMYSNQKAVLEVEYFGEVGTGLGPTLEFYTLLSHELQKSALGMWRTTSSPTVSTIDRKSRGPVEQLIPLHIWIKLIKSAQVEMQTLFKHLLAYFLVHGHLILIPPFQSSLQKY